MINLREFKQAVLQKAMQGKLTKQLLSDGNAKDLLVKIANYKRDLVQEGKLKGHSKSLSPVTNKEIPFKIPDNWLFDRIGNVASVTTGFSFKRKLYKSKGIRIIRISDFDNNGFLNKQPKYVRNDPKYNKFILRSGDSLMAMTGGSVGKLTPVLKLHNKLYLNQRVADFRTIYISKEFLNDYLRSNYVISEISNNKNSTNDNISMKFLKNLIIPLPPLTEQQRIVSKIHKCFLLADTIQKERDLHRKFAHDMKQSLLLEAMKGHLTQQLPSDGNADDLLQSIQQKKQTLIQAGKIRKHKKLPPISKDEIPFKIPKNWKWVYMDNIADYIQQGKTPKYGKSNLPIVSQKCVRWNGIDMTPAKTIKKDSLKNYTNIRFLRSGDILWNSRGAGTVGRASLVTQSLVSKYNNKLVADGNVFVVRIPIVSSQFIFLYIFSSIVHEYLHQIISGSTNQKQLNKSNIIKLLIPLPPLSEQHRIVSKLHDLFNTINA